MTTEIDLCNRALSSIRARSTIASFQENSPEARQCALLYAPTRDAMLRGAHWNFCRATAYLSLLKAAPGTPENPSAGTAVWVPEDQPPPPWLYEYAYPSDCLMVRYIAPMIATGGLQGGLPIFSVPSFIPLPMVRLRPQRFQPATDTNAQGANINVILTDVSQAITIYTKKVYDVNLWDSMFQEAFVAALASRLVMPISGDKTLGKDQRQYAAGMVLEARARDGNEGLTIENWTPDWIAVRGYVADWTTPGAGQICGMWGGLSFLGI